jgi:hypothetical protein
MARREHLDSLRGCGGNPSKHEIAKRLGINGADNDWALDRGYPNNGYEAQLIRRRGGAWIRQNRSRRRVQRGDM